MTVAERDAVLAAIDRTNPVLGAPLRRIIELYEESDAAVVRLRDALVLAKDAIVDLHGAGFDSTRRDIAESALARIAEVLAASPSSRERGRDA